MQVVGVGAVEFDVAATKRELVRVLETLNGENRRLKDEVERLREDFGRTEDVIGERVARMEEELVVARTATETLTGKKRDVEHRCVSRERALHSERAFLE